MTLPLSMAWLLLSVCVLKSCLRIWMVCCIMTVHSFTVRHKSTDVTFAFVLSTFRMIITIKSGTSIIITIVCKWIGTRYVIIMLSF